jgi:hypothetical protein
MRWLFEKPHGVSSVFDPGRGSAEPNNIRNIFPKDSRFVDFPLKSEHQQIQEMLLDFVLDFAGFIAGFCCKRSLCEFLFSYPSRSQGTLSFMETWRNVACTTFQSWIASAITGR